MCEETDLRHLNERVRIKDNTEYIKKYERIRARLKELLGDDATYIEHVGTTAVNDVMAYPVIDIAIATSTDKLRDRICKKLLSENNFVQTKSRNDEILIRKGSLQKPDYYIHLTLAQSEFFMSMLRFRDELKLKPKKRLAYDNIHACAKMEYMDDLDKYHHSKTGFIKSTSNMNGIENYDDRIHVEKHERVYIDRSSEIVEKICEYVLILGMAQFLVRYGLSTMLVFVFNSEAIPLFVGGILLSSVSALYFLCLALRERTNHGILAKRIMFVVFGAILVIDIIATWITSMNG